MFYTYLTPYLHLQIWTTTLFIRLFLSSYKPTQYALLICSMSLINLRQTLKGMTFKRI